LGVAQDDQRASEWYRLAANNGYPQAQARLEGLTARSRGESWFWTGLRYVLSISGT
jgi:TPR repeat protein